MGIFVFFFVIMPILYVGWTLLDLAISLLESDYCQRKKDEAFFRNINSDINSINNKRK